MKTRLVRLMWLEFVLVSMLLASFCRGQVTGVNFANLTSNEGTVGNVTYGFLFQVTTPFSIGALGVFDANQSLPQSIAVGVWNSAGTLLASTTVPAGSGGLFVNQFDYAAITPLALTTGQEYIVGAYYPSGGSDPLVGNVSGLSTAPNLTIVGGRSSYMSSSLSFPTYDDTSIQNPALFGANFLETPVPEMPTGAFAAIGLATLVARRALFRGGR